MKNKRGIFGILLAAGLLLCWGTDAYASARWAGLTAVLTADKKSVTTYNSTGNPFLATAMVASTKGNSQYSIMFEARGGSYAGANTFLEALITVQPGDSNVVNITRADSYHTLTLTGKDGLRTVKGCIGDGWLDMP